MNTQQTPSTANQAAAKTGAAGTAGPAPASSAASPSHPPTAKKDHGLTVVLIAVTILLLAGAFFLFRGKKPKPPVPPPVAITVARVHKGDIAVSVTRIGSVTAVYTASMSPRVDGQVLTVNYTEGQMVASNDLLAVIDPGPYQAVFIQSVGQLERDTNLLAGANVDLQRYQAAYAKNAIAKQQVDDQLALVHQDEGTVKLDEGQVAAAKVNVDYCYIRAPFNGRVGLRLVDPGNIVHAANSNAMVVVVQLQPITVIFHVQEDVLPEILEQLKENNDMIVEAWDRDEENKLATGKVLALDNMIDTATGTVGLRAIFDNKDLSLFPNQFVNAKLIIKTLHGLCLVPDYAIQRNPDGAFVYVITNRPPANTSRMSGKSGEASSSTASNEGATSNAASAISPTNGLGTNVAWVTMRSITPGTTDGSTTAITQGLEPGEEIALDNFNKLGEGVKVLFHRQGQPGGGSQGPGRHRGGSYGKQTDDPPDDGKDNQ